MTSSLERGWVGLTNDDIIDRVGYKEKRRHGRNFVLT